MKIALVFAFISISVCSADYCEENAVELCRRIHFREKRSHEPKVGLHAPLQRYRLCRKINGFLNCTERARRIICGVDRSPNLSVFELLSCADEQRCKEGVARQLRHKRDVSANGVSKTKLKANRVASLLGKGARTSLLKNVGNSLTYNPFTCVLMSYSIATILRWFCMNVSAIYI